MSVHLVDPQAAAALLLLGVPVICLLAATAPCRGADAPDPAALWGRALAAAAGALALALSSGLLLIGAGPMVVRLLAAASADGPVPVALSVRLDALTVAMLVLVTFIGLVILRFSRAYLGGDPGQSRYVRWFLATVACVALLVVANDLLMVAVAWTACSLSLHQLLTHFRERPAALIAAHKKFLASRVADACLLCAFVLLGVEAGSLEIDLVLAHVAALPALGGGLQTAAALMAVAAALKCAQLPFHGWLIQVMEAPTPVSALLHAGIVNIGGFLMIRFAPLMVQAEFAQTLLVACGTLTAVVAALVATTRVSIKVALAWSTCAQMGFMLLECGLGQHALALLHLLAHGLYKAHAFLRCGSVVDEWRAAAQGPVRRAAPAVPSWVAAMAFAAAAVLLASSMADSRPAGDLGRTVLAAVVAMSLAPTLARAIAGGWTRLVVAAVGSLGVVALYFCWHGLFAATFALPEATQVTPLQAGIALAGFALLFVLGVALEVQPSGALARRLHPWLFAGLHLDELCTRATFRLWPAPLRPAVGVLNHPTLGKEVRP